MRPKEPGDLAKGLTPTDPHGQCRCSSRPRMRPRTSRRMTGRGRPTRGGRHRDRSSGQRRPSRMSSPLRRSRRAATGAARSCDPLRSDTEIEDRTPPHLVSNAGHSPALGGVHPALLGRVAGRPEADPPGALRRLESVARSGQDQPSMSSERIRRHIPTLPGRSMRHTWCAPTVVPAPRCPGGDPPKSDRVCEVQR